ncbi:1-acyl-sn-glycerol-3-phosphate acyltransferase [Caulobacter sp. RHG1]|uniref:1-acyl-sn-glycerol-3-phosphate acyltransferase n=1 Tax=Caulobacter sp. (strain RHG1) TaxID=2545762 RepID=UPI00155785EE|nr:1-acyl-sn-glycerol-3-phosphate acyltransferase [Caulobacter sp. RHG1]NQE62512.1 Acyltransferase family protein [Caulobacter sp. RHG1]
MVHVPAVGAVDAKEAASPHIIDTLIAERAPRLTASAVWPLVRPGLYKLLDYKKARRMAQAICHLGGRAALDHVSELLALKVEVSGLENLPASGRVIIVSNHPTGIGDGVAVYDAIKARRPDVVFYANADAHRVCRRFDEVLIPVEWVEEKRSRERMRLTLSMTREAMEAERALMIFPAGRLAMKDAQGQLTDPPWMTSAVSIARKYEAPIVPIHLTGPWSTLFHLFDGRWRELRDITLFHELLNKKGRAFSLIVGAPIDAEALPHDAGEATEALKRYVERVLPTDPASHLT